MTQASEKKEGTPTRQSKIEALRKNYEKRIQDKWRKALKVLGINENLYPNHKDDLFEY